MTRKKLIIGGITFSIIVAAALILGFKPFERDIWDTNAEKIKHSFNAISGDAVIDNLTQWTPFEWDTLYSFAPYTPKENVYEKIGCKWDEIKETVNEGMNQVVFLKDGKVVCYLYGYTENLGVGFNFGKYDGSYIKLLSNEKALFKVKELQNGARYLEYTNKI